MRNGIEFLKSRALCILLFTVASIILGCSNYGLAWYTIGICIAIGHFIGATCAISAVIINTFIEWSFRDEEEM